MKKILIAVPCMNQVPAEFAHSLSMLEKIECCAVNFKIGSLVYTSRDQLAKDAIEAEADYVLWLDSDMVFPPDTLKRLMARLEDNDVDIISGLYFRRVEPFTPTLFDKLDVESGQVHWTEFTHIPAEPFEVGGCGFGCVLMSTEVIMSVMARFNQMFTPINGVGEDLSFCWRARQLGYRIWCDPTLYLGHVGYTIITRDYFLAYQTEKEKENAGQSQTCVTDQDNSIR